MRHHLLRHALALVLFVGVLPSALAAQADPRLERLETEALDMVAARGEMVQEMVDSQAQD